MNQTRKPLCLGRAQPFLAVCHHNVRSQRGSLKGQEGPSPTGYSSPPTRKNPGPVALPVPASTRGFGSPSSYRS